MNRDTSPRPLSDAGLYIRMALASIRAQMQYKVSFFLATFGQFAVTIIEVVGIWALFERFGSLPDWTLYEVCLFYGIVNIAFATTELFTLGFDELGNLYIRTGQFDRLLTRPRGLVVQLFGHELTLRRLGRFAQGFAVLTFAIVQLELTLDPATVAYLLFVIAGGVALFMGIFVFQATLSFWTVESLEVMNTLTYGGVEAAQYPMSIYEAWFRRFFTYIVPVACIAYYPVLVILGKDDPTGSAWWFQLLAPLAGFVFLAAALTVFLRVGVRHYTSTGS